LAKRLADVGRCVGESWTTAEDALYSAALLKPKPSERWLLITAAMHMSRAVGCFRAAGFQVTPYPVEFMTRGRSGPLAMFATGFSALIQLDRAAKECHAHLQNLTGDLEPNYEFQIHMFRLRLLLLAPSASFARHGFSQCHGEGVYRRPQLHHCPGLARAPGFYETHQLRLKLRSRAPY
jgi:hypothetical protein